MESEKNTPENLKAEGLKQLQNNHLAEAKALYTEASRLSPDDANTWHMLSAINGMLELFEESEACARKVIALQPDAAPAYTNLGTALLSQDKTDQARQACEYALQLDPQNHEALNSLGNIWLREKEFLKARDAYKKALQLKPDYAQAYNNLGNAYLHLQRPHDALQSLQVALQLKPDYLDAIYNYAKVLQELKQYQQALSIYNQVLRLQPEHYNATFGIGDILQKQGEYGKAIQCYETLLTRKPDDARLLATLAGIKKDNCQLDDAIQLYKKAIEIEPGNAGLYSNYLFTLNYLESDNNSDIAGIHKRWGETIESRYPPRFTFKKNPNRNLLTIGFVSHDFRAHSVAYFFEPLVNHYNHVHFKFICYANMAKQLEDDTTLRIRNSVDLWRNITELSDSMAADMIFEDRVDILFDLSGHTAWNRLPVFALRPAPLQISWLGYPNTTGLKTMDFRLTDPVADPSGLNDSLYTEKLLRLPNGFLSYLPPASAPDPASPPVAHNRYITFGSFNALPKIGKKTLTLWCRLLDTVPDSRLLLKNNSFVSSTARERFIARIADQGINPERIFMHPPSATIADHMELYSHVDIALDTFPYNGTTTTCESLWMGVPVVTLSGDIHASRVSHSILHQLKLDGLVAKNPDQYINIAATLAGNVSRLEELRTSLRGMFAGSLLGQHEKFTREFEDAIKKVWNNNCHPGNTTAPR